MMSDHFGTSPDSSPVRLVPRHGTEAPPPVGPSAEVLAGQTVYSRHTPAVYDILVISQRFAVHHVNVVGSMALSSGQRLLSAGQGWPLAPRFPTEGRPAAGEVDMCGEQPPVVPRY